MNVQGDLTSQTSGFQASFFDGSLHLLGIPKGDTWSHGEGINNTDQMAASAGNDKTGVSRAYAVSYVDGLAQWQVLPLPGAYTGSLASGITLNARAVTGAVCTQPSRGGTQCPGPRAAVWSWTGTRYQLPALLPLDPGHSRSVGEAIVKTAGITLVAGYENGGAGCQCAVVWRVGSGVVHLKGAEGFPSVRAAAIAHGRGSTFYVGGQVWNNALSTSAPAEWTIRCTQAGCTQVGQAHVFSNWGFVSGVNSQGLAVGYQRPDGDGGGDAVIWQSGAATTLDSLPSSSADSPQALGFGWGAAINDQGQIAAVGQTQAEKTHLFELSS